MYTVTVIVANVKAGEKKVEIKMEKDELEAFQEERNKLLNPILED
jgi:hypothetical protein